MSAALHDALRHALAELEITRRAAIAHDRDVLENFNEIRACVAASLKVSRDHLVAALDEVDRCMLAITAHRLDQERGDPDTPRRD